MFDIMYIVNITHLCQPIIGRTIKKEHKTNRNHKTNKNHKLIEIKLMRAGYFLRPAAEVSV